MNALTNLQNSISMVKGLLNRSYLETFAATGCAIAPLQPGEVQQIKAHMRLLKVKQLAYSEESVWARMSVVYQTLYGLVNSCFLVIDGTPTGTTLYVGIQSDAPGTALNALMQSLDGNFPGIVYENLTGDAINTIMTRSSLGQFQGSVPTVAAVSVVPAEKEYDDRGVDIQGLEKYIDSMQGKTYTAVLMATPYAHNEIEDRIVSLESIATSLSPLEKTTVQISSTTSASRTDSTAQAVSNAINTNLQKGFSLTAQDGSFKTRGNTFGIGAPILNTHIVLSGGTQNGVGTSHSDAFTKNISASYGSSVAVTDTVTQAYMSGSSQGSALTRESVNKEVSDTRELIERKILRLREGSSYGIWDCCGYFVSQQNDVAIVAANAYKGLISGKGTDVEQAALALWQPGGNNRAASHHEVIRGIIRNLQIGIPPLFLTGGSVLRTDSMVTGHELPRMMCFPLKSAGNITVVRMSRFGRRVHYMGGEEPSRDRVFRIGQIYHMGKTENTEVCLESSQLNEHTLIIGASGTGKTTAVESVLEQCYKRNIPFTVIEPVKGEYSKRWEHLPNLRIFSVNPRKFKMLHLNPFAFDESVHILEHLERVYSVFTTAWPLYAAQPAVLRECVQIAYIRKGWDLVNSICLFPERRFPVFQDVFEALPDAINNSHLVGETRATYEGAIGTRVRMLTQGLYGEIFNGEYDIDNGTLFDGNTIINLDGLGSPETLSFMMGILLIRLYEHRMASGNSDRLRHVTVLEEAHNILKNNTSQPVGEDTASIGARSVEVITKCVAELRSTGEGFIIVDQSPGNLDTDAMKNTATKIVLSLREEDDIKAAASTLALTEEQTGDLPKLGRGVAIIRQRGWAEPVLAKIEKSEPNRGNRAAVPTSCVTQHNKAVVQGYLAKLILISANQPTFSAKFINDYMLHCTGFSQWKLDDYCEKVLWYGERYKRLGIADKTERERKNFFGNMLIDLLEFAYVFRIFPCPIPNKMMRQPYWKDTDYQRYCREWRDSVLAAMEQYAAGLDDAQKDKLLEYMLAADTGSENMIWTGKTLYGGAWN